jgi:hypothetical protein
VFKHNRIAFFTKQAARRLLWVYPP